MKKPDICGVAQRIYWYDDMAWSSYRRWEAFDGGVGSQRGTLGHSQRLALRSEENNGG